MDILFINSYRDWGGGEVWLTQIVKSLQTRGHRITVVCRPDSVLQQRLSEMNSSLVPLRISGDLNPFTIGKIYRLIKARNIHLVCVHTEKELRVGGIASLLAGVPVIVSREVDFPIKNSFLNRLCYRDIAAAIIVNSFATKNTLLISAPWLRKKTINVIWKGIDPTRFRIRANANLREEFRIGGQDVVAGFVGRLDEQKGIWTLLEAMSLVVQRSGHLRLVLAGDGNMRHNIEEYCRDHKLDKHVHLAGFREDVPQFMRSIDFLVMPSNWEGFGYAVVEAMAAGKPVIASHVSSLPEIVEDSRTGLLVPPRSPEKLAEAMWTLLHSAPLRSTLGRAGVKKVEQVFTLASMVEKTESLFLTACLSRQ